MPELPEVETIIRMLRAPVLDASGRLLTPGAVGKTIAQARVLWPRSLATPAVSDFQSQIAGQQILAVDRRGKFIQFALTRHSLLIHLRMSGDLFQEAGEALKARKHDRMLIDFSDGSRLVFNDTRKFGRVWLVKDPSTVTAALGLEPFDPSLTAEVLFTKMNGTHRQIKPLLLNQSFLAGLGNIYTDEALFLARIHPEIPANLLTDVQSADLLIAIRQVLNEGIKRNGASIDWVYRGGDFQNHFQVYQRDGKPCFRCGTTIQRITLGQRGTHFCPHCQPRNS